MNNGRNAMPKKAGKVVRLGGMWIETADNSSAAAAMRLSIRKNLRMKVRLVPVAHFEKECLLLFAQVFITCS